MTKADRRPYGARQSGPPGPSDPSGQLDSPDPSTFEGGATCAAGGLLLAVGTHADGTTVELRLQGELDVASADTLRRNIGAAITDHDPHRLLLDLSELSFADSSGLSAIVWAHKVMSERGRQLSLHHPQASVLRVLHLTGLHTRLHVTEADAAARGPASPQRRPATPHC